MRIDVLTLFPEMFDGFLSASIIGRARAAGLLDVALTNIRDYTLDKHRRVDDYCFGGGAGLVMAPQPIVDSMRAVTGGDESVRRIYLSPKGKKLTVKLCRELAGEQRLALLCGHYEGIDERAIQLVVDEEISIGDFILTGGEVAAMALIDAVSRFIPGVLGSGLSAEDESFSDHLLEYPQYTRPREYEGLTVPEVLLNGNHAEIDAWRRLRALELTARRRPDLLEQARLSEKERAFIQDLMKKT